MNAYRNASFIGIVLFIIGIVIAIYGFSFLTENTDLEKNGIRVKGKVVDINEKAIYRSPFVNEICRNYIREFSVFCSCCSVCFSDGVCLKKLKSLHGSMKNDDKRCNVNNFYFVLQR